jgi:hypothetical protein
MQKKLTVDEIGFMLGVGRATNILSTSKCKWVKQFPNRWHGSNQLTANFKLFNDLPDA